MPKICCWYANDIPKICWDMHKIYSRYAQAMPEICNWYAWDIPEICPLYTKVFPRCTQDMPAIWLRHAWDVPKICLRYYWDKPKICQKYALRCAKGMPKIHMLGMPNMYHDMPQTCPRHAEVCLRSQKDHWLRNSLSNTDPRDASASKIPSEMEVVPRHAMFHCLYLIF